MRLTILAISLLTPALAPAQVQRPLGLLRPTQERYLNYPVTGIAPTGVLPARASLESYLPPPGDQGLVQGSCTAWSTTFALRTALEAKRDAAWQPLSDLHRQFSPAFVFNRAKAAAGQPINCAVGIYFDTALEILRAEGVPTFDRFSYDPNDCAALPDAAILVEAGAHKIAASYRVADLSLFSLKSHLAAGDPVLAGIDIHPSFDNAAGPGTITGASGAIRGYHAIVLIGYDDTKSAFRLQNSWGDAWGDHGRAWMDYQTFLTVAHEAYRVAPLLPPGFFMLTQVSRFGIVNDRTAASLFTIRDTMLTAIDSLSPAGGPAGFGVVVSDFPARDTAVEAARAIAQGPSGLTARVFRRALKGRTVYSVVIAADLDSAEAALVAERAKRVGFRTASIQRLTP